MVPPVGLDGIVKAFGDPRPLVRPDGTMSPLWESGILANTPPLRFSIPLGWDKRHQVTRIRCHRLIVDQMWRVFERIHERGLQNEVKTFDGTYAWRTQRGNASKISCHAWGIAIDLNAFENQLGTEGEMHPGIVECFEGEGFLWGGRFSRPDPQHWQFAKGY